MVSFSRVIPCNPWRHSQHRFNVLCGALRAPLSRTVMLLMVALQSADPAVSLSCLKSLRRLLSRDDCCLPSAAVVPVVTDVIVPLLTSGNDEQKSEALWCLANVAAGGSAEAGAVGVHIVSALSGVAHTAALDGPVDRVLCPLPL